MHSPPFQQLPITGIGLVVGDAPAAARAYAELLGIAEWRFHDVDLDCSDRETVRIATARVGRIDLELVQPLTASGTHRTFLDQRGSGVHHISLGEVGNLDELVAKSDLSLTLDANVTTGHRFVYLEAAPLATRLQLAERKAEAPATPWGTYIRKDPGATACADREIVQLGIVVDDVKSSAAEYTRVLGVSDWQFLEFEAPQDWHGIYKDVPAAGCRFHLKAAIAWHGAMQIELLEPVSGTSTHMDYLRTHGPGIHHLSFDVIDDHDEVRAALAEAGVGTEMGGELGKHIWFTYLDTRDQLGTIFEIVGRR